MVATVGVGCEILERSTFLVHREPVCQLETRVALLTQATQLDDSTRASVLSACTACGVRGCSIESIATASDLSGYAAAIVVLSNRVTQPLLTCMTQVREAGLSMTLVAPHAAGWPVAEKCRWLLAGVGRVVDSKSVDFTEQLQSALRQQLTQQQQQRTEERRIRRLALDHGIVGASDALLTAFRQLLRFSVLSDVPVLVRGESGTGKELFASALHGLDPKRCDRPMVAVNCAAINAGVAESQLFGHVKGAFTGAGQDHNGLFAAAHGTVLFLDEIGELSLEIQAKILRVLQERRVQRVGASKESVIDVRIVAATNRDLQQMIRAGQFRADLYHRLNTLSIDIPPVRGRAGDLPLLVEHFLGEMLETTGVHHVEPELIEALSHLQLPGNVRELRNLMITALASKTDDSALGLTDLPVAAWREIAAQLPTESEASLPAAELSEQDSDIPQPASAGLHTWNLEQLLASYERDIVVAALRRAGSNQSRAAQLLGLTPRSIYNKLRRYELLNPSKA